MSKLSAHGTKKQRRFILAGAVAAIVLTFIFAAAIAGKYLSDPNTVILLPEQGATWIRLPQPTDLFAQRYRQVFHGFRRNVSLNRVPEHAVLNLRALRRASVFIDKRLVFVTDPAKSGWKKRYRIDIAPYLSAGTHEIFIKVLNAKGHPALLAYCPALGMRTGNGWEAGADGKNWVPAVPIDPVSPAGLSRRFLRADRAFLKKLPVFTFITVMVFLFAYLLRSEGHRPWVDRFRPSAGRIRFVMMGLWALMALNNIAKIPSDVGMDLHQHVAYILSVAETHRIPLPGEGVQMFESPFFYMLSAALYKMLAHLFSIATALRGLRVIPIICGLIQIEICYRASRTVFPARKDLQATATLIGGFFPMNIYMSQVIGTESLAGVLSATVVLLLLRFRHDSSPPQKDAYILLGLLWGLAVLTKVTAVLLLAPMIFFSVYRMSNKNFSGYAVIKKITLLIGIALVVSGWYYLRNWMAVGKFFIGGWDPARGMLWWQDPGYRSLSQFFRFGESLFYPFYAGVTGFWDALYSTLWMDGQLSGIARFDRVPPWNYDYMLAGVWLSLLPTAALILGLFKAVRRPVRALEDGTLLAASCLVIYMTAILYLFLTVPIYSIVKGTYTLGVIPCYAVLGASGFEMLTRRRPAKTLGFGILLCWAFSSYAAYFVI